MPETPNHGYNVPDEGEQDWHEPLNENFEQYDTDIEIRDSLSNRSNYDPADGAKFFATDTGDVLLGDGSNWRTLDTSGRHPRFREIDVEDTVPRVNYRDDSLLAVQGVLSNSETFLTSVFEDSGDQFPAMAATRDGSRRVGIGVTSPATPLDVRGQNNWNLDNGDGDVRIGDSDHRLAIGVSLGGAGRGTARLRAKGGTERLRLGAGSADTVEVEEDSVSVAGDLDVSGNKNFTQAVEAGDGVREVVYTATESGTPHTEVSGVAELDDGRAEVDLPEHFGWVTSDEEPIHVQTTPYAIDSAGLAVVERGTDRLVVTDRDGTGDYQFAYTVKGTRSGQEDKRVVREPRSTPDRPTGDVPPANRERQEAD